MTGTPIRRSSPASSPRSSATCSACCGCWRGGRGHGSGLGARAVPGLFRLGVALRVVAEPERRRARPPGLRSDLGVHPLDQPGLDPGPPRPSPVVEPLERARHALDLRLAGRHLQRPGPVGYLFPLTPPTRSRCWPPWSSPARGVYVLGRVLGLGVLGCTMAATVFELSGPLFGWLGWPIAAVNSWAGWLLRRHHSRRTGTAPGPGRRLVRRRGGGGGVRRATRHAGACWPWRCSCSSPCCSWPGAPRFGGSGPDPAPRHRHGARRRGGGGPQRSLAPSRSSDPPRVAAHRQEPEPGPAGAKPHPGAVPGIRRVARGGSRWFGPGYYMKSVAYLGVIAVVLAGVAVVAAVKLRWHRPEVHRLQRRGLVMGAIVYVPVVESLLDGLPLVGSVLWRRATMPMAFAVAVLAGMGARSWCAPTTPVWCELDGGCLRGGGRGDAGAVGLRPRPAPAGGSHHPRQELHLAGRRRPPWAWPSPGRWPWRRAGWAQRHRSRRQRAGSGWARCRSVAVPSWSETVFLVTAGTPLWSSSPTYLSPTPGRDGAGARAVGHLSWDSGSTPASVRANSASSPTSTWRSA